MNWSMIGSSSPSSDPRLVYTVVAYVGDDETFSKNIARALMNSRRLSFHVMRGVDETRMDGVLGAVNVADTD